MARKEATRLKNQSAIQAIVDGAVKEKEDDWIAILSLKFEVRVVELNTDIEDSSMRLSSVVSILPLERVHATYSISLSRIDNCNEVFLQGSACQTSLW